ncbi:hypothetical protein DFR41_106247 [Pseudacidovorax intermedius]|uniref:Transposase n=1 Tax=Pseudacidovorax intermedius TaxID=433924 RepID=A0A370FDE8_9BURK|nr:hypothetical protein DFR41_106247 [Pseudacidovorax intermedius]
MHQSKKGNPWHFGMKAHIGVDAGSGLVHWRVFSGRAFRRAACLRTLLASKI